MPCYWLRGTGLPLWSGHRAAPVGWMLQSYQDSAPCKANAHMPVLAFSKGPWTTLIPPHPHNHISGNKTTAQARGTLIAECTTDSSLTPSLCSCCCSIGQVKLLQGGDCGFVTWFWDLNFPGISLPWVPAPSLKSDAYKLDSLQRLEAELMPRSLSENEIWTLFYF